jgi:hypothetical protein
MPSAVLCQTEGLGSSFPLVIQVRMAGTSSLTERWVRRDTCVLAVEGWTLLHGLTDLTAPLPSFSWPSSKRLVDAWVTRFKESLGSA